jgi:hypothetical protein
LILIAMLAVLARAGEISGVVRDARGGEALARVEVRLADTAFATHTDAQGRFSLTGVPPGDYILQISTVGYRPVRKSFSLAGAELQEFEVILSPTTLRHTETVEVAAGPFDAVRPTSPSEITLSGSDAKNLASVLADDPLRAVQALPGVASNDDFDARFSLRGADYTRVGLYLDDILLHAPFHMVQGESASGSLTIFNGDMLDNMSLHSGAFPSRFTDRTAGVLDVATREGSRVQPSVRLTAGAANSGMMAEGPLGPDRRGSWLVAVRKSYLQYIIQRTTDNPTLAFGFLDAQGKLSYDLSPRHSVSLNLIDGHSNGDRTAARDRLGANSVMTSAYHVSVANLGWRYTPSEHLFVTNHMAFLRERFDNQNPEDLTLAAGMYCEWVWNSAALWTWSPHGSLDAGWSLRRIRDDGFTDTYQFNPLAVRRLDDYRGNALREGGYAEQGWSLAGGRLHLTAGLRWDRHSLSGIQAVSPHASLGFRLFDSTRLQLGWGQYVQYPELQFSLSRFGSRTLLPERANHFIAAIEQRLDERTRIRVELYERQDRDLLARPFYDPRLIGGQIFNPPSDAPYRNSVRGYARGAEIFLQRRTANRLTGWVSYALGYARVRDGEAEAAYPADQDQRHTVNVYAGYRIKPSVNLSARWTYGSGFPIPGYLRYDGSHYYLSESRNLMRLGAYQRADFRVNKSFGFRRSRLTLYGEVVNLLNRDNYRFDSFGAYNARTGQAAVYLDKMFPILPSAGIVLEIEGTRDSR